MKGRTHVLVKNDSNVRQNLKTLIKQVNDNSDIVTITSNNNKNVVMMSESDYHSIIETLYLQQNPNNAKHLAQSITDLKRGNTIKKEIEL
mgnify:FL=1